MSTSEDHGPAADAAAPGAELVPAGTVFEAELVDSVHRLGRTPPSSGGGMSP